MKELYRKTYTRGVTLARAQQQFIVYGIIGMSGATLDFLAYLFLYKQLDVAPPLASFISVSLGITNNFIWNLKFNFKVNDKLLKRFTSFYAIGLVGALVSAGLIAVLQKVGIDPTIAKLLTIPPVVLSQYILNKKLSFGESSSTKVSR